MSASPFAKLAQDIASVAGRLEAMTRPRTLRVAQGAARMAASVAPVETGRLRGGIQAVQLPDGSAAVEATITSHDDYYAHFQEYGTSTMAPNPFVGPAVDRWAPRLQREVEDLADDVARELS